MLPAYVCHVATATPFRASFARSPNLPMLELKKSVESLRLARAGLLFLWTLAETGLSTGSRSVIFWILHWGEVLQWAIFLLWFALSGWLFRLLILATSVLPFATQLLIRTVANNLVIKVLLGLSTITLHTICFEYYKTLFLCSDCNISIRGK